MSKSEYQKNIREKIGHDLLLMPGVAAVIRDKEGRILVQKTKKGSWNLPAGAVDPGEKPAQAIIREVFEETGLIVRPIQLIAVTGGAPESRKTYESGDVAESTTVIFACDVVGGELEPQDDETERLEYRSAEDLPKLPPEFRAEIFEKRDSGAWFEWDNAWLDQKAKA